METICLRVFLQLIGSVLVFRSGILSSQPRRRFRLDQPPPDTSQDKLGLTGGIMLAIGAVLQGVTALVT